MKITWSGKMKNESIGIFQVTASPLGLLNALPQSITYSYTKKGKVKAFHALLLLVTELEKEN